MINTYGIEFDEDWPKCFGALDKSLRLRIAKKIGKILVTPYKRHLRKLSYFVDQVGQYRIVYKIFEEKKIVKFYFIGDHKEYEKWYK